MTVVADLHVHSTASDGRQTYAEVLAEAARRGLRYLVFTDHSTVTWHPGIADLGPVALPFPGTEISTYFGAARYHLTLYGFGLLDPALQEFLSWPNRAKNELAERVCADLVAAGHDLPDPSSIRELSTVDPERLEGPIRPVPERTTISRSAIAMHVARHNGMTFAEAHTLVAGHYRRREATDDAGRPFHRYLPTEQVLARATEHGLLISMAHPLWRCQDEDDIRGVVRDLAILRDAGLAALETRSYHHRPLDDHPLLLQARDRLGLLPSGGSDYHANGKTELGVGGIGQEAFDMLAERVTTAAIRS